MQGEHWGTQLLNLLVKCKGKLFPLCRFAGYPGFVSTTHHCERQPLYLQKTKELLTLTRPTICCKFSIGGGLNHSYYIIISDALQRSLKGGVKEGKTKNKTQKTLAKEVRGEQSAFVKFAGGKLGALRSLNQPETLNLS